MTEHDRFNWKDCAFTTAVVLAIGQARDDIAAAPSHRRFDFVLLAASAAEDIALPPEGWYDDSHQLHLTASAGDGGLQVVIQAIGFAALQAVAGHAARLRSPDGTVDVGFSFDRGGRGVVALADTPALRQALQHLAVSLDGRH